jgi:cob(I)alamin adenosyltransferase
LEPVAVTAALAEMSLVGVCVRAAAAQVDILGTVDEVASLLSLALVEVVEVVDEAVQAMLLGEVGAPGLKVKDKMATPV